MKIKEIYLLQRSRERMKNGETINDAELLALILESGYEGENL